MSPVLENMSAYFRRGDLCCASLRLRLSLGMVYILLRPVTGVSCFLQWKTGSVHVDFVTLVTQRKCWPDLKHQR